MGNLLLSETRYILLVLLIEGLKFVAFISLIFNTLLQEDIQGLMTVLCLLFCGPCIASEKIVCKGKQVHRKNKEEIPFTPIYPIREEAPEEMIM